MRTENNEWSKPLRVVISKRNSIDQIVDEGNLLPPLNFRANILAPNKVQLLWNKSKNSFDDNSLLYYIVNIRQLSANSIGTPLIQEVFKKCT